MKKRFDVIIVGAGVAGITAARFLSRYNLNIKILEARNRIGGRLYTVRDRRVSLPVELGAEFIHGRQMCLQLADQLGFTVYEIDGSHHQWKGGKLTPVEDFWEKIGRVMESLPGPQAKDESFAAFLKGVRGSEEDKNAARYFVEGFHACDPSQISVQSLAQIEKAVEETDGNRAYRMFEGYDQMPFRMLNAAKKNLVDLGCIVDRIEYDGAVEVFFRRTRGGTPDKGALETAKAKCVLISVPLGVLSRIQFYPSLEEKERALEGLAMGQVARLVFLFSENFWSLDKSIGFFHSYQTAFPTFWTTLPVHSNVVTGWAGGTRAEKLLKEGFKKMEHNALESLACMTRKKLSFVRARHLKTFFHDWQKDPFSRGAYSYVKAGGLQDVKVIAASVADQLFFAGEATDFTGQSGTVNGAILSGERAAKEIIATLT